MGGWIQNTLKDYTRKKNDIWWVLVAYGRFRWDGAGGLGNRKGVS